MAGSTNSKDTRVQPVFRWLKTNGSPEWPQELVGLAQDLTCIPQCGPVTRVALDPEDAVPPTPARLAWMIRNAERLAPQDGKAWREVRQRVSDSEAVSLAVAQLDTGRRDSVPRELILEGKTHADCLIECKKAFVWIEGKRFDWLSPSIKWDVTRDQLARNIEAVWSLAKNAGKDYCLLICHEHSLKHDEQLLVNGYRSGTWSGGLPHVYERLRLEFGARIGTITWRTIVDHWPTLGGLQELHDLDRRLP